MLAVERGIAERERERGGGPWAMFAYLACLFFWTSMQALGANPQSSKRSKKARLAEAVPATSLVFLSLQVLARCPRRSAQSTSNVAGLDSIDCSILRYPSVPSTQ